jgi:hypothetical protein
MMFPRSLARIGNASKEAERLERILARKPNGLKASKLAKIRALHGCRAAAAQVRLLFCDRISSACPAIALAHAATLN